MKSKTRLDSAVFQLTPTRTRCDLIINANGVSEKIFSGLLMPFLAHLNTAQHQIAQGGYSITLQPPPGDPAWFTKATLNRFVRFVNTPEVLERVNTIESEIIQIGKSVAIQLSENLGLSAVNVHQEKTGVSQKRNLESNGGIKEVHDTDTDKAIVLYQPDAHQPESNGSVGQEENSKVQLLKVLETRKAVLQKEQGMAFARAVAAGFEMDHIAQLISFGESFGAIRLMEACIRFVQLWKEKHETGQWLEIDSAETISSRSEFSSMITPGTEVAQHYDIRDVLSDSAIQLSNEGSIKANVDPSPDKRIPVDSQVSPGNQQYFPGQYQHTMFPHWPIHSPPGAPPVFPPYPMHGMPYYQNYPGSGPFFQPPYPPIEDPRFISSQRVGKRRQSMDSTDSNTESESGEQLGSSNRRSQDASDAENEGLHDRYHGSKYGKSNKKQAGMVVIRNVNYITSNKQSTSGSESESASDPERDDYSEDLQCDTQEKKHKSSRSSKFGMKDSSSTNIHNTYAKNEEVSGQETSGENWQAFQNFLLRNDKQEAHHSDHNMFSTEKETHVTRRKNSAASEPIIPRRLDMSEVQDGRIIDLDTSGSKATRLLKASSGELLPSGNGVEYREHEMNVQSRELGARGRYRRATNDDFMILRQENHLGPVNLQMDLLAGSGLDQATDNRDRRPVYNVVDESFVVPTRSRVQDSRAALDMDVDFPSELQETDNLSGKIRSQTNYEPEDLSLIPERGTERGSIGYDPAIDYEMQVQVDDASRVPNKDRANAVSDVQEGAKKVNNDKKLKGQYSQEKRKMEAETRKGKPSKLSLSTDAQARAANLRAYKADLQKMKKEKEEEDIKRLEALKRERQKRIAGRSNSNSAQSQLSSHTKPRLPTKLSPNSHSGSKSTDSKAGSSSPIRRFPIRTTFMTTTDSKKSINSSRLNSNGLTRSVSSLSELKKEKDSISSEPKLSMARTRRLSEPKTSTINHTTSVKLQKTNPVSKSKVSNSPEIKKISAIISLDKTKAATLPELKIRTPKEPSDLILDKSAAKEVTQKANETKPSIISGSGKLRRNNEGIEPEILPVPSAKRSDGCTEIRKVSYDEDTIAEVQMGSQYTAINAPATLQPMVGVAERPSQYLFNNRSRLPEVKADQVGAALANTPSTGVEGKPYPRVSSMEDSSTAELKDTSAHNKNTGALSTETTISQVSGFRDLSLSEESLESSGKSQGKEHSKGFKRLLMFGRKNVGSSAVEPSSESEKSSTNSSLDDAANSASYEVHTLKNLLSQDETPTANTSQKASRHFSLLSPFRSKASEKKQAT